MKVQFEISGGRWSAVVSKIEPEAFGHPDPLLVVEICCDDTQAVRFVFCPFNKRAALARASEGTFELAHGDVSRFSPSLVDLEDLLYLVCVTDSLCQCLHDGGTVERRCARHGLRPVRRRKLRRRPGRPSALLIQADGLAFILPPQHACATKEELRGGLYR
jgi:hypothetical protein